MNSAARATTTLLDLLVRPRHWPSLALGAVAFVLAQLPIPYLLQGALLLEWPLRPFARRRYAIIERNLELCFPELSAPERDELARRNFRSSLLGLAETLIATFRLRRIPGTCYRIDGLEHIDRALAEGHGVLVLSGHFHAMFLCGRILSEALGQPVLQLVRRHNDPALEWCLDFGRRRYCQRTIEKKDMSTLVRVLRAGQAVGYAPDQDFNLHAAFVPFFGQPAATLTTTSRVLALGRARAVPVSIRRVDAYGSYRVSVEPPLNDLPSPDPSADAATLMALIERQVRAAPEQYLWAHRRFKTRPPGAPDPYADLRRTR